jgi:hypothetical protein
VADANAGPNQAGRIIQIDPVTGSQRIVAEGLPYLSETTGAVFDPNDNQILAVDRDNGVIRVNPADGTQTRLTIGGLNNPAELVKDPFAIALDAAGNIYVADSGWRAGLITCETLTQNSGTTYTCTPPGGTPTVLTCTTVSQNPPALNSTYNCIVPQVNTPGQIVQINRTSGTQTVHASGGNIVHPFGLAYDAVNMTLYASDMSAFGGQGGIFSIPSSGQQIVVWGPASANPVAVQQAPMGCPLGLAYDGSNDSILATVFAYPALPPQNVYGCVPPGIFRVHLGSGTPGSGSQVPGSVSAGWSLPFGIAVEPNPSNTILVVDEGLNGIYRLSSSGSFIFGSADGSVACTPGPVSPCGSAPSYFYNPVGINIRVSDPTANVGTPPADPAPTVSITGQPAGSVSEGTVISLGSAVTPSGSFTYLWTLTSTKNGTTTTLPGGTNPNFSFTASDNGTYAVGLTVTTSGGTSGSAAAIVSATNVAPSLTLIDGPLVPLIAPSTTTISVNFTDPGAADTHTCVFAWGDGSSSTVPGSTGSGSCSLSHVYPTQGVYTVSATVSDADGGSAVEYWRYVVIYDPTTGSVNGNGEVVSPATPLRYMLEAGKAKFGFTAKYKNGSAVPDGSTGFQVKVNKFKFKSTSYDWLVISGATAQFKGSGFVKKHGNQHVNDNDCENENHFVDDPEGYMFLLTAVDGSLTGGGDQDRFRVKIVNKVTGEVVYDNLPGAGDDPGSFAPPVITKGKIKIKNN